MENKKEYYLSDVKKNSVVACTIFSAFFFGLFVACFYGLRLNQGASVDNFLSAITEVTALFTLSTYSSIETYVLGGLIAALFIFFLVMEIVFDTHEKKKALTGIGSTANRMFFFFGEWMLLASFKGLSLIDGVFNAVKNKTYADDFTNSVVQMEFYMMLGFFVLFVVFNLVAIFKAYNVPAKAKEEVAQEPAKAENKTQEAPKAAEPAPIAAEPKKEEAKPAEPVKEEPKPEQKPVEEEKKPVEEAKPAEEAKPEVKEEPKEEVKPEAEVAPVQEEKKEEAAPAPVEEPKPEVKEEKKPVEEEPAPAPKKVVEFTDKRKDEPKEEVKAETQPAETAKRQVVEFKDKPAVAPEATKKKVFERVPFETKLKKADNNTRNQYNEIRDEIMSYGIKSRVTDSGDTFRLHKVKYMRMTIAGTRVKLYMKLDPKKFNDSTIPHGDASDKKIYSDVPFVFKIHSDLSMRRAKELIAEMMKEAGIEKKN